MSQAELSPGTVRLGEVTFDPVSEQDFRLSVEGTSNVGKSNTLAVILEDLADVAMPTLIVERLGALSTVRFEDEDLVVVGAKEEEGVDLAVSLDELEQLGSWILDRGMKVLVDISTYADYTDERSRVHLAAAKAIRSLNDRAHEKYRAGDRTKSLLVVDEAHVLAPKDSAPEPEFDDWVKRCRGQLIKASTEGGNKGISTIVAYQRRAFLHNGVIQLCEDYISHKPGSEDIDRTSDALRCDEEVLAELDVGEIVARGSSITGGDLVGPTKVRKRNSPDPREETFELPDTPDELTDVLEEIQSEVEAERERREERQSQLDELRERNESLQEQVEQLEEELQDSERIARALERIQEGEGGSAEMAEEVERLEERRNELAEKAERLEAENEKLQEERDDLEGRVEELEQQYEDDLAALNSLRSGLQMMGLGGGDGGAALSEATVERLVEEKVSDVDVDGTGLSESRIERIVEEKVDEAGGAAGGPDIEDVHDVLLQEFQEEAIERVMEPIEGLSDQQRKLLRYLEAQSSLVGSRKRWAQGALGFDYKPKSHHYENMNELIEIGLVQKNNDGAVRSSVRERVEEELEEYDVDGATIDDTYREILTRLD